MAWVIPAFRLGQAKQRLLSPSQDRRGAVFPQMEHGHHGKSMNDTWVLGRASSSRLVVPEK